MRPSQPLLVAGAAAYLCGCGDSFPPASHIDSLRVLAVVPEPASGIPGEPVHLELVYADGGVAPGQDARPLEIAWLGGCHNPPTRQFFACYPLLDVVAKRLDTRVVDTDPADFPPGVFGTGSEFDFPIAEDFLDRAPRVATDPVHFGVSFNFFGVCAGELRPAPELTDRVPLRCVDAESHEPLGAEGFVTGFTTVFTYEGATNANPALEGVMLDEADVRGAACAADEDCADLATDTVDFACTESNTCVPVVPPCTARESDTCPEYAVLPLLDRESAEPLPGEAAREVVWANYYATFGSFQTEAQLVNDRQSGWIADPSGRWRAPPRPVESARLWVTVHDQRSGTAWDSFEVIVRDSR